MAQAAFMETEQETTGIASSPPYISFLTLTNCLDWLGTEGVPHRFDRSFWSRKYSGSVGPQILTALRFLGLLQGDMPQPALEHLVASKGEERKKLLIEILQHSYRHVKFDLLAKATPAMLHEWMEQYSIGGETLRKAESFLINALKEVGFPLSPQLQKSARNRPSGISAPGAARKPKASSNAKARNPPEEKVETTPHKYSTITKELKLNSGGEITLKISVNLFDLSEDDREFVMGLVDSFRDYPEQIDDPSDEED